MRNILKTPRLKSLSESPQVRELVSGQLADGAQKTASCVLYIL